MDNAQHFSFQGQVFIGIRNPDGSREPARWVFDASVLEVRQAKEREERKESWSGERAVAATMSTGRSLSFNLTLGQMCTANAALALDGARVEVASGTVTSEVIGNVQAGDVVALNYAAISDLALEDGAAAALVEDTDYTVDELLGIVKFLTTKTGVDVTGYDYAAHSLVTIGNAANVDYYILFAGLNTTDGANARCRGELYSLAMNPSEAFGFIHPSFGDLSLSGVGKADPVRQLDPQFGPFGRYMLLESA